MRQDRNKGSMWRLLAYLTAIMSFTSGITLVSLVGQEAEIAWQAVNNFLSWQKFWYGTIQAERCYHRLIDKEVPVTFYWFGPETLRASSMPCYFCQMPETKVPNVPSVTVRIGDSVLQYDVDSSHEAKQFEGKAVVSFNLPYDPQDCRENGAKLWDERYRKEGVPKKVSAQVIHKIAHLELPAREDNLRNDVVLNAVQRSMAHFLRHHYFKEGPQETHRNPVPETLVEKVRKSTKLRLGRFRDSDPSLLVWYEGDNTIYELPFLAPEVLMNEQLCLNVSKAASTMGFEQEETTIEKRIMSRLDEHSILLELPDWSSKP